MCWPKEPSAKKGAGVDAGRPVRQDASAGATGARWFAQSRLALAPAVAGVPAAGEPSGPHPLARRLWLTTGSTEHVAGTSDTAAAGAWAASCRSEEHTSELQSLRH